MTQANPQASSQASYIKSIEAALSQGNTAAALSAASRALKEDPDSLEVKLWMGIAFEFCGENAQAIKIFEQAHERAHAGDVPLGLKGKVKYALGLALLETRNVGRAAYLLQEAVSIFPSNPGIYEALVKANLKTGAIRKALEYGQEALNLQDEATDAAAARFGEDDMQRPRPFNARNRAANLITFSLAGDDEFMHECALRNCELASTHYPEFTPRFYCDEQVPDRIRKELKAGKAEIRVMPQPESDWESRFWPLWAFDEPDANVVLVRAVNNPLSEREAGAVREWLFGSITPFHVIRDNLLHCQPVTGDFWGGFTRLLPPMELTTRLFLRKHGSKFAYQRFLLREIWARTRTNTFAHDANYSLRKCRSFEYVEGSGPLDDSNRPHHVGWSWPRPLEIRQQAS